MRPRSSSRGAFVARLLEAAWRNEPPPLAGSLEELRTSETFLHRGAVGALVGHRLVRAGRADEPEARPFVAALDFARTLARLHVAFLERLIQRLGDAGVDALVGKGWAAAELYAEPHHRAYSDVDLFVRPEHAAAVAAVLDDLPRGSLDVDVHIDSPLLAPLTFDSIFARRRLLPLGGGMVPVLGAEDHLRLITLHAMQHGLTRPLWLCDVAAALERTLPGFDWDRCLGDVLSRGFLLGVFGVAVALLGGRWPVGLAREGEVEWLRGVVVGEWSRDSPVERGFDPASLRDPGAAWRLVQRRWPNPILTHFTLQRPFGAAPERRLAVAAFGRLEWESAVRRWRDRRGSLPLGVPVR